VQQPVVRDFTPSLIGGVKGFTALGDPLELSRRPFEAAVAQMQQLPKIVRKNLFRGLLMSTATPPGS
jgi:hypothetical protein